MASATPPLAPAARAHIIGPVEGNLACASSATDAIRAKPLTWASAVTRNESAVLAAMPPIKSALPQHNIVARLKAAER